MKPIKVIKSHIGLARFLCELGEPIGEIARIQEIPSPYAFSPTHPVYQLNRKEIFIVETKHKRYEVFEIPETSTLEMYLLRKEGD